MYGSGAHMPRNIISAQALIELYARGEVRPSAHVAEIIDRIEADISESSAFVSVDRAGALTAAHLADEGYRAGQAKGTLCGVPVSVKDLLDVAGMPTGRGRGGDAPIATHDSPIVKALRRAGVVILGKTRTSEDGWSASTVGDSGIATVNPWCPDRTSGGSSGGAARAVATGLGSIAIGTDGAGSVRIPAAWCGVVGFKPTWERWAYGSRGDRLSHVGCLTATVEDSIILDEVAVSVDPGPIGSYGQPLRLAWLTLPHASYLESALLATLNDVIGELVPATRLDTDGAYDALVHILAAGEHQRLASCKPGYKLWPGHAQVGQLGANVTGHDLGRADETCACLARRLDEALADHDALVLPTVAVPAFGRDEEYPPGTSIQDWLAWAENTYITNLTGHPAISLPWGLGPDGVPVGLQLIGRRGQDRDLLKVARELQGLGDTVLRKVSA